MNLCAPSLVPQPPSFCIPESLMLLWCMVALLLDIFPSPGIVLFLLLSLFSITTYYALNIIFVKFSSNNLISEIKYPIDTSDCTYNSFTFATFIFYIDIIAGIWIKKGWQFFIRYGNFLYFYPDRLFLTARGNLCIAWLAVSKYKYHKKENYVFIHVFQ